MDGQLECLAIRCRSPVYMWYCGLFCRRADKPCHAARSLIVQCSGPAFIACYLRAALRPLGQLTRLSAGLFQGKKHKVQRACTGRARFVVSASSGPVPLTRCFRSGCSQHSSSARGCRAKSTECDVFFCPECYKKPLCLRSLGTQQGRYQCPRTRTFRSISHWSARFKRSVGYVYRRNER